MVDTNYCSLHKCIEETFVAKADEINIDKPQNQELVHCSHTITYPHFSNF